MLKLARMSGMAMLGLLLSGCGLTYYWQAVGGQLELLRKRTPTTRLVADPEVPSELRQSLTKAAELRRFAIRELRLPDNGSYTTYVDLDRNYAVWNVIAAEEFSVDPVRWCFPFAGCVAYRGYFDRAAAEQFESTLASEGFDTHTGGATAYSTLGYFDDPLLNTMLVGGEEYIAALLFHELAHQRLYVKSDSAFNEAFATAVEEYGLELWLERTQGTEALARYRQRMLRRAQFGRLVADQRERLRDIYAEPLDAETMRLAKEQAFEQMRSEYEALKEQWGGVSEYDRWFARSLNNASLAAVATYRQWLPALRTRLDKLGIDGFYAEMEQLAALSKRERHAWLRAWTEGRSAPSAFSES